MALITGLEGRRSVQSKLVLFTALFTILSAFSIGATVKSGDFKLDDSEFDFSENAKVAVWSEERPKTTENVSPNQPLNPGEELPLGVAVEPDTGSVPQFGEELELYSTQDGTDYQKITDYGFLNRHLKLENGELSFVVPSVEIEGSKGLNTEDAIQVEGRVHGEDLKQASDETEIDVSEYIDGKRGDVNLRQVREGEDKSYTVKVDKASPQVKNISKINSTAVRIQIEDLGAAKISNESFLTDNRKLENDVFSYEPITSELGTDAPGHKFRYLKDESSADEAVYLLLLDEKFEESKALEIFLNSPISDTQGNEITNLGLEGRVNDMNDQPPQVMTELVGDQQLTIGGNFKVKMYARSVDDVESVSIDASEISENGVKSKSQGLQKHTCGNDWESECVKFEKEFAVTRGSDGLNTIEVSASNENGKTGKEKQVDLSIVPQDAQEITVYDRENGKHDGYVDTAEVKFESEIKKSSVNSEGWKLIGPEDEAKAVSATVKGGSSKVVELTFESDIDTTDANKVDVVYNSPQNDFLKTSNGARVPSINKGTIVETDEAAPVPVDYRLQEDYDKAVLRFSEKIKSAQYEGSDDNFKQGVEAIEDSKMAIVNIDVGVGSPDEFEEEFSAEDGTDSGSVKKAISRSEAGEDSRFVVVNKGWNIAALPKPGDVEGTATTDESLDENEELSSLSCVKQTYRRVGSWSTGVSDLSHKYGTYVESNRPCILEFSAEDADSLASIGNIDSSEVGQGWNLLSPYTESGNFNWIDDEFGEDVNKDQIFAPEDAIEEDVSLSDDEDDLNRYDSYWVENEN
jgi:hypothetical protein